MKIYRKEADTVHVIAFPGEQVRKGEYLLIEDQALKKGLLVQIIDIQFANIPGMLEDLLRDVMTEDNLSGNDYDPLEMSSQIRILKDARILICKIRRAIEKGNPSNDTSWLPSRLSSTISIFPIQQLVSDNDAARPIRIGTTFDTHPIQIDARCLDGKLSIIVGKKGTGKSHLSKLLLLNLIRLGAPCIVFDVNGEYIALNKRTDKEPEVGEKIIILTPRRNMRFTLSSVGLRTLLSVMLYSLDLPPNSARVLSNIWHELERGQKLSFSNLGAAIQNWECHESIRDALYARFVTLAESGLFTDDIREAVSSKSLTGLLAGGGGLVVDMSNQSSIVRRIIVELILNNLIELLSSHKIRAVFLFAEEAHLYLRETYWDDVVTRMRHLGVFTTFVTNQPDTVDETIYRQADNLFIFNFTNEHDIETISKASKIDAESVRLMVRDLPPQHCLAVGEVVNDLPLVLRIAGLDVETLGKTRFFFQ